LRPLVAYRALERQQEIGSRGSATLLQRYILAAVMAFGILNPLFFDNTGAN
jgi:hypothetical protein